MASEQGGFPVSYNESYTVRTNPYKSHRIHIMKIEQIIKHFGSQIAIAEALGVQQPAVSMWKTRGHVPHLQQLRLQHLTNGKLKAAPDILKRKA